MKEILEQFKIWKEDHDEGYVWDEIHDFFNQLDRSQLIDIIDFVSEHKNKD